MVEKHSSGFRIESYGPMGWLLSDGGSQLPEGWIQRFSRALELDNCLGVQEWVPGFENILLIFSQPIERDILRTRLSAFSWDKNAEKIPDPISVISVSYDGPDLESFARTKKMSVEEVVRRHSSPEYQVRILGFSPGFPYLDGLDPVLRLPRKAKPVSRIEVGSVAVGGSHAGVYSIESPGGWHILGRTDRKLFDVDKMNTGIADEVFLLRPGVRVRFEAI